MTTSLLPDGLTVVELGDSVSASLCGHFLQLLGAEVIKIEPPGGTPLRNASPLLGASGGVMVSATFTALNSGKKSAVVDLDAAVGQGFAGDFVERCADVVLMSGTRDLWQQRGLSADELRRRDPRLVVGRITDFGDDGPYVGLAGGELQAAALGGLLALVGSAGKEPMRLGGHPAQSAAGLALLLGVALGVSKRDRDGVGSAFTTSVLEAVAHVEWKSAVTYEGDGVVLQRGSLDGPLILRCRDGFAAFYYRPEHWPAVKTLFGDARLDAPEFGTQPRRNEHRVTLVPILESYTTQMTKRDVYARAQGLGIPVGYVATMGDLITSPQYEARGFINDVDLGSLGVGRLPGAPWSLGEPPASATVSAPELGEPPASATVSAPELGEHDDDVRARAARTNPGGPTARARVDASAPAGILDGIRVTDLSIVTAGGASTQVLADYGADVIKIEAPDRPDLFREWGISTEGIEPGDLASHPFRTANRNKRAIAVDLKDPRGLAVALGLVRESELVVENFRRGVVDRLGLGFEDLAAQRPNIVLLSISSQGSSGPHAHYGSFGSTLDALGGQMAMTGYDQDTPLWSSNAVNYPDQVVSLLAPALAVFGIRAARATGRAIHIDLSQRETVTSLLGEFVLARSITGVDPVPVGNDGPEGIGWCCRCAGEDEWLALTLSGLEDRTACAAVVGVGEAASAIDDVGGLAALREATERWCRTRSKAEAMAAFQGAGVPAAAVMRGFELLSDAYFEQIAYFQDVELPSGGTERQRGWPVRFEGASPASIRRRAPHLGEHTREVLAEILGYGDERLVELVVDKVVAGD